MDKSEIREMTRERQLEYIIAFREMLLREDIEEGLSNTPHQIEYITHQEEELAKYRRELQEIRERKTQNDG
jgi:hypothetical protein